MKQEKPINKKIIFSWLWLLILIVAWEVTTQLELVNTFLLPPFSKVVVNLLNELASGRLGPQIINSIRIILIGFLLSFTLAVVIMIICVRFRLAESLFLMLSTILSPLPAVALMPIIIMWFGIKTGAMLALVVHAVLWALLRHLLDGMHSIPPVYWEWGRNIGLPPWRMFTDIIVYAIMPEFLSGARIGWSRAWRALISAEMVFGMIGTLGGLGYYIYLARAYASIINVMSGVVVIIIIGIVVETLFFGQIEKYTIIKWGMSHE
jgi:NitT/TauT family transport system permease protein